MYKVETKSNSKLVEISGIGRIRQPANLYFFLAHNFYLQNVGEISFNVFDLSQEE